MTCYGIGGVRPQASAQASDHFEHPFLHPSKAGFLQVAKVSLCCWQGGINERHSQRATEDRRSDLRRAASKEATGLQPVQEDHLLHRETEAEQPQQEAPQLASEGPTGGARRDARSMERQDIPLQKGSGISSTPVGLEKTRQESGHAMQSSVPTGINLIYIETKEFTI